MTAKSVIPRAKAREDVDAAIDYYLAEAGTAVALAFIDAIEIAYAAIAAAPAAGSPRWSHELDLPGLRTMRVKGFPWLTFYVEQADRIDIWRVLHSRRDIPAWLGADENSDETPSP